MKKIVVLCFAIALYFSAYAQTVSDTVTLGSQYANQVWYSLEDDETGVSAKNNWDLAFAVADQMSPVRINFSKGVRLWVHEDNDTSLWATLDTTGLASGTNWKALYDSDESWDFGAFSDGRIIDYPNNNVILGWARYNTLTHTVLGIKLYVVQLADGSYKKLWIKNLSGGTYNFISENLDGTGSQTHSLSKNSFPGTLFGYYSLETNATVSREPVLADWDLTFTQYGSWDYNPPYNVTGVLSSPDVLVAQADGIADVDTYEDVDAHVFTENISEIGYNWKAFTSGSWVIADSTVYFVKKGNGDIWKLIFTDFTGGGTGSFMFSKEKLDISVGIDDVTNNVSTMSVYPNPVAGKDVTVLYSFEQASPSVTLSVIDLTGKTVYASELNNTAGFFRHNISAKEFEAGMYIVNITNGVQQLQQKLIVY